MRVHQLDVGGRCPRGPSRPPGSPTGRRCPDRNICGCSEKPGLPVAPGRLRVRRGREHPAQAAAAVVERGREQRLADALALEPAAGRRTSPGTHISSRVYDVAKPTIPSVVLGDPAAAGVGARGSAGCGPSRPAARSGERSSGSGQDRRRDPDVELVEPLGAEPLRRRRRRPRVIGRMVGSVTRPTVGGGRRMPACAFSSPRTSSPARSPPSRPPSAMAEGWRGRRPTTSSTSRRCPTAGPGSSTSCTRPAAASCSQPDGARPVRRPGPGRRPARGRHGVRRERAGVRPAPDRRRRGPSGPSTYGVGELVLAAIDGRRRTVVVGLGGSGTNDGGAGLLAALGATADRRSTAGVAALAGISAGRPRPGPGAVRGRRAGRGHRRGQPAHRPVRRDQDLRPAEGHPRGAAAGGRRDPRARSPAPSTAGRASSRAPARPAASATRCSLLGAAREPGIELVGRARSSSRSGPGRPTWWSPARAPSTSPAASGKVPYGVAAVAAEALRPCVAIAGQVLVGSREMRALGVESAYSLVDAGRRGAGVRRPGGRRWPTWPRGWPAPGRAETDAQRSARRRGITPDVRPLNG